MKSKLCFSMALSATLLFSCTPDRGNDPINDPQGSGLIDTPVSYVFTRNGESSVSYSGQITRLSQSDELYAALNSESEFSTLDLMFNGNADGNSDGFSDSELNGTSKIIGSKTSSSALAGSATIKAKFDDMISDFSNNVVPNWNMDAVPGTPGVISTPDGSSSYNVNAMGQEIDQTFFKGLIGAFTLDQIINNYIHPNQLDSGSRRADNDNDILDGDSNYTEMEHKWDEGFGYLYGHDDPADTSTFGSEPSGNGNLLMKYLKKVDAADGYDPGIGQTVYDAFILGRTAIVNKDYELRDQQANIIKVELSKIIGYYAIHYMNDYVAKLSSGNLAGALHAISEGHGFIRSLQYTNTGNDIPFMSKDDVEYFLENYMSDFYSIDPAVFMAPIEAPYPGMIALIKQAFEANGVTLNI